VEEQFEALAQARDWKAQGLWLADANSQGLFEKEYFSNLQEAEGSDISAGGFVRMAGDETDALLLTIFLRDLSSEHSIMTTLRDENNPIAKLRQLTFEHGHLPTGKTLEDTLAQRPVIKKVQGEAIFFYPPNFRLHAAAPSTGQWAYALCGLRASAPSLLEAEQEALKILRGLRHLSD
jgi:hypothetical protein